MKVSLLKLEQSINTMTELYCRFLERGENKRKSHRALPLVIEKSNVACSIGESSLVIV